MLVLTRNTDQSLFIGEDIKIQILDIRGGQVRIGIEAPKHISIMREELIDKAKPSGQQE